MTISMVRYYRVTLVLPLLVSAVVYLLGRSAVVPAIPDIVWFSMILGGIPYLLLARSCSSGSRASRRRRSTR